MNKWKAMRPLFLACLLASLAFPAGKAHSDDSVPSVSAAQNSKQSILAQQMAAWSTNQTIPRDVQLLITDLRLNLAQLQPLLANFNATNLPNKSLPAAPMPVAAQSNELYALGAVLEDVQADLKELLPRLAAMAGQTNYAAPESVSPLGAKPGN